MYKKKKKKKNPKNTTSQNALFGGPQNLDSFRCAKNEDLWFKIYVFIEIPP